MKKKRTTRKATGPAPIRIPDGISREGGCKVGWQYYASEAEALAAKPFAMALADQMEAQGYDFGYQSPGWIERIEAPSSAATHWPYGYLLREEDKALTPEELRSKYPVIWSLCVP